MLGRFLPPDLAGVDAFKELVGVLGMFRDVHAIQNIYRIEDGLLRARVTCSMAEFLAREPAVTELLDGGYLRGTPPDMPMLRTLPDGSVGRELARHIDDYDFDAHYYQQISDAVSEGVDPRLVTALNRLRETHDVWHVVLGFAPTPVGEIGLKAFELAQTRRPLAGMICGGAILRYVVAGGEQFDEVVSAIAAGYRMGRDSGPLLAERFEQAWDEPVADIRRRLGLELPSRRELGHDDPKGVKPSRRDHD